MIRVLNTIVNPLYSLAYTFGIEILPSGFVGCEPVADLASTSG
jgi:hypothetical protein